MRIKKILRIVMMLVFLVSVQIRLVCAGDFMFNTINPLIDGWKGRGVGEISATTGHLGQDYSFLYGSTAGKPVYAVADGVVVEAINSDNQYGWCDSGDHGWGRVIVIKHEAPAGTYFKTDGSVVSSDYISQDDRYQGSTEKNPRVVYTLYGHLSKIDFKVKKGDIVKKGQLIARLGDSTEQPWSPHLHFEIKSQAGFDEGVWDKSNLGKHLKTQSCNVQGVGSGYSFISNYAPERYRIDIFINLNISSFVFPLTGTLVGVADDGNVNQAIFNTYIKEGGYNKLGLPFDNGGTKLVHTWNFPTQDLQHINCQGTTCAPSTTGEEPFGTDGQTAIVYNPHIRQAFFLRGVFWGRCKQINCLELLGPPSSKEYYELPYFTALLNKITRQDFQYGYMTWDDTTKTLSIKTKDNKILFQTVENNVTQNCLCPSYKTSASGAPEVLVASSLNNFVHPFNALFNGYSYSNTAINMIKTESESEDSKRLSDCHDHYADEDDDGYSDGRVIIQTCVKPVGYKLASALIKTEGDCNDKDANVNPRAIEIVNGKDDNCNKQIDEQYTLLTLTVCPSGCNYSSIQSAINASKHGDTILVSDGIYYENIFYNGKGITIKSVNGADKTIIDGKSLWSVVYFDNREGLTSVLDGFTLQNGNTSNNGGGVIIGNASPTIKNCKVINNKASTSGGGIYIRYGSPIITNVVVSDNTVLSGSGLGGGIFLSDTSAIITNSTISKNSANQGGGIYADGSDSKARISGVIIENNTATGSGGGVMIRETRLYLDNSRIINNKANDSAGVSFMNDNNSFVSNSIISGNYTTSTYGIGGGVNLANSNSIILNTIISGNQTYQGGGVWCSGIVNPQLINVTIAGNKATYGGGIFTDYGCTPKMTNGIVWGNLATMNGNEVYASRGNGLSAVNSDIKGGWYNGSNNFNSDPLFLNPQPAENAPNISGDYHIQAYSPMVDLGIDYSTKLVDDIDGQSRPAGRFDVGADEIVK